VREGFYLYHERQSNPSWINDKCQNPSTRENPKERGTPLRVLTWIDVEGVGHGKGMRWKARKGAPMERGAHTSKYFTFYGFLMKGGANPLGGELV
jgi:hypothetical protein